MVYRWTPGFGDSTLQMVKKPTGEYTTNIPEMDAAIRAAWKPINRRYESMLEPSVDKFMDEDQHHVKHSPLKARVLTGDVLLQRATKMGVKTANGLDVWSIKLLKPLLAPLWDAGGIAEGGGTHGTMARVGGGGLHIIGAQRGRRRRPHEAETTDGVVADIQDLGRATD